MLSTLLKAAGFLAVATLIGGAPARAADLGAYPRYGYGDNERTYDDRYGERAEPPYYDRRDYERQAGPPQGSLKDDDRIPYAAPYQQRAPAPHCLVANGEVRSHLTRQGWSDFRGIEIYRGLAVVDARRPDGLFYRLQVDRCSGVIVSAVLIEERRSYPPDRSAYGPRPYLRSY